MPPPVIVAGPKKSIREWATCDGTTDDHDGLARAFEAAKDHAFVLEIDCPVFVHIGSDVARPIFVDSGTAVDVVPPGLIIVDNVLIPAFVLADTIDISLTNWNIEYVGSLPVNSWTGGYYFNGRWVDWNVPQPPAHMFSDGVLKAWLISNRGITFQHGTTPNWPGPSMISAIFYLFGNTSHVSVQDLTVWVPPSADADHFAPGVFAMSAGETPDQLVTTTSRTQVTPNSLRFDGVSLDGTYFGWVGMAQDVSIADVLSYRYGDLQDAEGNSVGGISEWFAPPHLIYFPGSESVPLSLQNRNIDIRDVIDYGERIGTARDASSGNCYSLKVSTVGGTISNYTSYRPDGLMDVLMSTDLTVQDIVSVSDSSFDRYAYPIIRFPGSGYHHIVFNNVHLQDVAADTDVDPIRGNGSSSNSEIVFGKTMATMNHWTGEREPGYSPVVPGTPPYFGGIDNRFDIRVIHK